LDSRRKFKYSKKNLAGAGIQTNALAFGGFTTVATGVTEQYDGTSWISIPSMSTARRQLAGAGTATAALGFGGYPLHSRNRRIQLNNLFPSHGCLGERREYGYREKSFRRSRNSNCWFSFWRKNNSQCCKQQKNMMARLGQAEEI
jgi:hypothetical protein